MTNTTRALFDLAPRLKDVDFPGRSRLTPYVGVGGGIGRTELDYGDLWARNPDPDAIGTAAGLPNEAEIRRTLAATTTSKQAELHDRLTGYQVLGGVDYAMSDAVSLGVKVRWVPRFVFEGRANFLEPTRRQSVSADLSSLSGMLAAYMDLPELGLPRLGPFSPFIGGGVGAARTEIGETRMTFPRTTTIVPGASQVHLAWMLTAGVATALGADMTLDLAWRYTDLGAVETGRGEGRVVWRDGSRAPLLLDLAATRAKLRCHGVQLSLRYAF